jgi:hypothetical protein
MLKITVRSWLELAQFLLYRVTFCGLFLTVVSTYSRLRSTHGGRLFDLQQEEATYDDDVDPQRTENILLGLPAQPWRRTFLLINSLTIYPGVFYLSSSLQEWGAQKPSDERITTPPTGNLILYQLTYSWIGLYGPMNLALWTSKNMELQEVSVLHHSYWLATKFNTLAP